MKTAVWVCTWATVGAGLLAGCSTAPRTAREQAQLTNRCVEAIQVARRADPGLETFFQTAAGFAVFPAVDKGGLGLAGAYGRGELFEGGKLAGFCVLTQTTIGLVLGGQTYTELIFFENQAALDRFKSGRFALATGISAVMLKSGAAARAHYTDGIVIFSMAEAGLMYEAAVGGQKFSFQPI
jgi:lipid-binding SYLF domain-containing protein